MSEKDGCCDYCKDAILSPQEDVFCIQKGYINKYKEFMAIGEKEILHERCHNLIRARAVVMEDISAQLQIPDFSKRIEQIIYKE
jgi:hypothetical protein